MTEAQIQLQNALTTTFLANLAFLSEYDKDLYHRVDELSRMIERCEYKEKYALEFNMQDGDFDIYDIVNDKYLYDKKPTKINNELVRKSEQYSNNYILDFAEYFSQIHKNVYKIDKSQRFEFEYMKQFNTLGVNNSWEYVDAIGNPDVNDKKRLKNVKKFIFLGTLLGRHIPRIAKKIDANSYLVLEKNLEIFRLSLFTVDYTILAKKRVVFSIMDSVVDTENKIGLFLKENLLENYLIKFSTTNINIEEYIDNILSCIHLLNPVSYDYNRILYSHINRTTKYIKEEYKFLLINKAKENINILKNVPVLYIAAGPSLDDNLDWIKENQNKFFIVTIGAAYKKLLLNNIHINMIVTVDEQYTILNDKQFDDESVLKIDNNTIILASNLTNKKILDKFNQRNLYLFEVFGKLHNDNISFDGFSVGEITLDVLLNLNAKEIYLIGLDLALNQKTGDTHSKNASSGTKKLNLEAKQNRDTFDIRSSLVKVKGNHSDFVYTTPLFFNSIKSLESKLWKKNKDVNIFNLSTNGAYFEKTIARKIDEIKFNKVEDISAISSDFIFYINKNSTKELSIQSKDSIKFEIDFIQNNIIKTLEKIEKNNYDNFDKLFIDMSSIPNMIIDNKFNLLYRCILNYFQIFAPYLLYHFNDIKIKNENKKVNKIQKIFVKQVRDILKDYIECLKRVI